MLLSGLLWTPDLLTYFGPKGLVSLSTMQEWESGPRFSLFFWIPEHNGIVIFIFVLMLLAAAGVALGLYTRVSLVLLCMCLISFHHRNVVILHSGDTLLRVMGLLLIFSPAGRMFSLDYLRRSNRGDPWEMKTTCWTQRLLQFQIAALYCQTFLAKLGGDTWRNGTAIYYTSRLEEFSKLPVPYLFDHLWTCNLLTWGTLVVEFSLWTLIWIRPLRYYVLAAGVLLHLGIDWTMNIPLFEYVMIASYVNFVDGKDLKAAFSFVKNFFQRSRAAEQLSNPQ